VARGNIKQRSKGSWFIRVELESDPTTGKRRQKAETFVGNKRDAEARMNELLGNVRQGITGKAGRTTVAEFLERWLRDHAEANLAPRTSLRYANLLRTHVVPHIGSVQLDKLRVDHVVKLHATLRTSTRGNAGGTAISAMTRRHVHRVLHTALAHAVRWRLIAINPAGTVKAPSAKSAEMKTWDADLTRAFLFRATEESPRWQAYFTVALTTGLRLSEMAGLRWSDVDLAKGSLHVRQTIQEVPKLGRVVKAPKTAGSRRPVTLGPDVVALLRRYKAWQNELRLIGGDEWHAGDLVFTSYVGAPIDPATVRAALKRIAEAATVPVIRIHDLRHTAATLMLLAGVHVKVVSERLGHANISITLQTYSHVLPTMQQDAAAALDVLLRRPTGS
jgi:integrase